MKEEYMRLIDGVDRTLTIQHAMLNQSRTPDDRVKWKNAIDESLDERIRLMRLRDVSF